MAGVLNGDVFNSILKKVEPKVIKKAGEKIESRCIKACDKLVDQANQVLSDFYNDYYPTIKYDRAYDLYVADGGTKAAFVKIPPYESERQDGEHVWKFGIRQLGNIHTSYDPPEYVFYGAVYLGYHGSPNRVPHIFSPSPIDRIEELCQNIKL
jgi:hypothetical protein